ncbi:hypothetical protein [Agrobacterium fabrum]|uniref:hypothetical protein n=1 Tax=Agrobacterium fabrum TaxID=1176649 RepID=UPI002157FD21|nr:hypothetical protein [Agrobacterium fabrum]MCR6727841.1 hypothetical protein [Agrobacterium fabrum]
MSDSGGETADLRTVRFFPIFFLLRFASTLTGARSQDLRAKKAPFRDCFIREDKRCHGAGRRTTKTLTNTALPCYQASAFYRTALDILRGISYIW